MFCAQCYNDSGSKNIHRYECPSMDIFLSSNLTSSMRMAVRTFFAALEMFDGSVENLEKFMNENLESRSAFDVDSSMNIKQRFLAANSLVSDDKTKIDETVLEEIILSTSFEGLKSHQKFIKQFLKKQVQIGSWNYHEICEWPLKKGGLEDDEINEFQGSLAYKRGAITCGNASFPFCALLNHSCSPNVSRFFINAKLIFVVMRSVDKCEQLFDSYGYNFTIVPKDFRQGELLKKYKFKCKCHACEKDWPLLPSLKIIDKTCFNKAKKISRELSLGSFNQRKAIEKFREVCDILEKGRKNYPSLELCSLEQSCSAFAELITKPVIEFP